MRRDRPRARCIKGPQADAEPARGPHSRAPPAPAPRTDRWAAGPGDEDDLRHLFEDPGKRSTPMRPARMTTFKGEIVLSSRREPTIACEAGTRQAKAGLVPRP